MANTKSAKIAARKSLRRTEINKDRRSALKTEVRGVEEAIKSGKKADALAALKSAEPLLARTGAEGRHSQEDRQPQGFPPCRAR